MKTKLKSAQLSQVEFRSDPGKINMLVVSSLVSNFMWWACGMKSDVDEVHFSYLIFKSDYFNPLSAKFL